jgi:hypothetical protein
MSYRSLGIRASAALLAAASLLSSPLLRAQENPLTVQGMDALAARATFHTDMTFDQSMLHVASQIMPDDERPIIAKLRSITLHEFRYSAPGVYDPAALDAVRAQFDGNGWTHVITKQGQPKAIISTDPQTGLTVAHTDPTSDPPRTDVWVRSDHGNFDGAVVLVANQKNVNVIVIDGMISPLDLLHLRGHFGIPRFGGDGMDQSRQ